MVSRVRRKFFGYELQYDEREHDHGSGLVHLKESELGLSVILKVGSMEVSPRKSNFEEFASSVFIEQKFDYALWYSAEELPPWNQIDRVNPKVSRVMHPTKIRQKLMCPDLDVESSFPKSYVTKCNHVNNWPSGCLLQNRGSLDRLKATPTVPTPNRTHSFILSFPQLFQLGVKGGQTIR